MQYLQWLNKYSKKYLLKIWAYCLMSNHLHFVGVPMEGDSHVTNYRKTSYHLSQRLWPITG